MFVDNSSYLIPFNILHGQLTRRSLQSFRVLAVPSLLINQLETHQADMFDIYADHWPQCKYRVFLKTNTAYTSKTNIVKLSCWKKWHWKKTVWNIW